MGWLKKFLTDKQEHNLLRTLRCIEARKPGMLQFAQRQYFDFSSNDYLGLSHHPKIKAASQKAISDFGTSVSASRLLSGDVILFHQLEDKLAQWKGKEAALVFNSGFQANVGIVSTLCGAEDVVFLDKLSHASLIDGVLLSGAKYFRFRHNDMDHLESLLQVERKNFQQAFILTETVFSMDGDAAPLKRLVELKQAHDCMLLVDEAHATGIFGQTGSGMVEEAGLTKDIDLIMGTFGKALGSFGAYLACSQEVKDYLVNTCRSFIYSTGLPPSVIAANLASIEVIQEEPFRRKNLLLNAEYFRQNLLNKGFPIKGSTQIIPLILGESETAVRYSRALQERGFWVLPIRPPTVPTNEARLRFSLTFDHSKEILDKLFHEICAINSI